jgi:prepilin-type N-terminal cleavage/methylation domain-containing protein
MKILPTIKSTSLACPTQKGFTLIELLVAITLMGAVAGFGIPGLYGSYQHQQMLNTSNEMIAAINQARAKAQANYQGAYTVLPPAGPLADCDATHHNYVDAYTFSIDANKAGYSVNQAFRSTGTCTIPNPLPAAVIARTIPSPITVSSVSPAASFPLSYTTTSGQFNITANSVATIDLISNGYLGNFHYYVCITQSNIYAQSTAC